MELSELFWVWRDEFLCLNQASHVIKRDLVVTAIVKPGGPGALTAKTRRPGLGESARSSQNRHAIRFRQRAEWF